MIKSCPKIEYIVPQSPAHRAGIQSGDKILSINRNPIKDALDLMFLAMKNFLKL